MYHRVTKIYGYGLYLIFREGIVMENSLVQTRRHYMRIKLHNAIGEIAIDRVYSTKTRSQWKPVIIYDISPGGVCISTDLYFPVSRHITLAFKATLLDNITIEVGGRLRWRKVAENMFVYGIEFVMTDTYRVLLTRVLNELVLRVVPRQGEIHRLYRLYNSRGYHQSTRREAEE